jgi:type IV secretory pathway TraG/TraD family ATPase VirD4
MTSNQQISLPLGMPIPITPGGIALSNASGRDGGKKIYSDQFYRPTPPTSRAKLAALHGTEAIEYSGDSHLMTIAPTGAGKGRSVIIPTLLTYPGPIIVVDPKAKTTPSLPAAAAKWVSA